MVYTTLHGTEICLSTARQIKSIVKQLQKSFIAHTRQACTHSKSYTHILSSDSPHIKSICKTTAEPYVAHTSTHT